MILTEHFTNWLFPDLDDKAEGRYRLSYTVEQWRGKKRWGRAESPFCAESCLNSKKAGPRRRDLLEISQCVQPSYKNKSNQTWIFFLKFVLPKGRAPFQ